MSRRHVEVLFQQGRNHHAAGRLEQAYGVYHRVIEREPGHADCHFRLGLLTVQIARNDLALGHFQAAIRHDPRAARYPLHLGMALDGLGRAAEAEAAYRAALEIQPTYPQAHNNLANTLGRLGRPAEAEHHYRAAIALDPAMPEAHNNLGHALSALGRAAEAEAACRQALALRPNYPAALVNRGAALGALGRLDEAEASYRAALGLKRDLPALHHLGELLAARLRPAEAAECYREILRLNPDDARTHLALGHALADAYRYQEAIECYRAALRFDPDHGAVFNSLIFCLNALGRQSEAILCYDEILRVQPDSLSALVNRCMARLPMIYRDEREIEQARTLFTEELVSICRLAEGGARIEPISGLPPFFLAYQGHANRDLQALYGGLVARIMAALFPAWASPPEIGPPGPGEKIRVGILSPFFFGHSNWKIPIKGWLTGLDKARFQIFLYHVGDERDDETALARRLCHRFAQGLGGLEPWAETIRADRLHVLLIPGIGLDALTHRLAALRLAPVQATSWGHPDTTGLPTVDHYLSSDLMEPPNGQDHYTERLIRLPNLSIAYEPLTLPPVSVTRAELGIPEDAIFYWCCQALFKYLPRHDWIYPHIAQVLPNSCFVFIEYAHGDAVTGIFRARLKAVFAAAGLDWARHCRFLPPQPMARFGAIGRLADVFLDSLGWSGCNTMFEALANDLPVVTMAGELMRGRHGSAILTRLGLPEMIASTPEDFVRLAIGLGGDPVQRQALRARIARDKHRLYHDQEAVDGLARYLEDAANGIPPIDGRGAGASPSG